MKRLATTALALVLGLPPLGALGAGDPAMGRAKAVFCVTCHGVEGRTEIPLLTGGGTHLAGKAEHEFIAALKAFRDGRRFHPLMQLFVLPMAERDMEDLAAYYASLGPSLYRRLGGREAIQALAADLIAAGLADPRMEPRMAGMDRERCENQLTDLLCQATGGPCLYRGRDVKTAHAGKAVTETEWQAFSENLARSFERLQVPARERQDLLRIIGPLKADVVGR